MCLAPCTLTCPSIPLDLGAMASLAFDRKNADIGSCCTHSGVALAVACSFARKCLLLSCLFFSSTGILTSNFAFLLSLLLTFCLSPMYPIVLNVRIAVAKLLAYLLRLVALERC